MKKEMAVTISFFVSFLIAEFQENREEPFQHFSVFLM